MGRFLTAPEKISILKEYERRLSEWKAEGSPSRPGVGDPDSEIFDLVNALNEVDGVCTTQSCAGHVIGECIYPGSLWLRLSAEKTLSFEKKVDVLLNTIGISQVSKMYAYEGQKEPHEIIEINFCRQDEENFVLCKRGIIEYFKSL